MRIGWTWTGAGVVVIALGWSALAQAQSAAADAAANASSSGSAPAASAAPTASSGRQPALKPGARPSPYSADVAKGHEAMSARNFAGAIDAYRRASAADPRDALALYFLGEAQVAAGELVEADAAFSRALAASGINDDLQARLLFVLADLRERQGNWVDAKRAWETYGEFAAAHPAAKSYAATAAERAKMVATHVDLDAKYGAVKKRAEQRAKEAAPPAPASSASSAAERPQAPPKKK